MAPTLDPPPMKATQVRALLKLRADETTMQIETKLTMRLCWCLLVRQWMFYVLKKERSYNTSPDYQNACDLPVFAATFHYIHLRPQ
jgi:hypothetical protein